MSRTPISEDEIVEVARLYSEAVAKGVPPHELIKERAFLSDKQVELRVRRAKDMGILVATDYRQASNCPTCGAPPNRQKFRK